MTGRAFYRKACRTSPQGRRERPWQREQEEQRSRGIRRSVGKFWEWSTGWGWPVGSGEGQPRGSAGDKSLNNFECQ